jgi:hypothetical protein
MESAATTFAQTLSGLLLDKVSKKKGGSAGDEMLMALKKHPIPPSTRGTWLLIATFLAINALQLLSILALWRAFGRRCARQATIADDRGGAYAALPKADDEAVVDAGDEDEPAQAVDEEGAAGSRGPSRLHQPSSRTFSTSSRRPLLWSETASTLSSIGSVEAAGGSIALVVDPRDCTEAEIRRGRWFFGASIGFLVLVWATFGAVSLFKG